MMSEGLELPDEPGLWIRLGAPYLVARGSKRGYELVWLRLAFDNRISSGLVSDAIRSHWFRAVPQSGDEESRVDEQHLPYIPSSHSYGTGGSCMCVNCVEMKMASLKAQLATRTAEKERLEKRVSDLESQIHTCPKCGVNCKECRCMEEKIADLESQLAAKDKRLVEVKAMNEDLSWWE